MIMKKGVPSANIKTHVNKGTLQVAGFVNNKQEFEQAKKEICEELNIKSHEFEYIVNRLYDIHFEDIYFKTKEELLPLIKEELKNI